MNPIKNKYRMMTNPNSYSRITCSAFGCDMRSGTNALSEIKMFQFPKDPYRRRRWELATRRANWKAGAKARLCSKHFITGKPSKDPKHPDYIPSIFVFNKDLLYSKSVKKKLLGKLNSSKDESSKTCTSSHAGTSCGIKGFCRTCFSPESVSSAFNISLEPVNQTLAQLTEKLKDMEEERQQLHSELAACREEIHQLREMHQHCIIQSTSKRSKPRRSVSKSSKTSNNVTKLLESMYSEPADEEEDGDIDDLDTLSSTFPEEIYLQSDKPTEFTRQKKYYEEMPSDEVIGIIEQCSYPKKKRVKVSDIESSSTSESSKATKSTESSSPLTIVYLKR